MGKKKVLFLLEAFDKGGIEKVTLDIVNNLNPTEYDITIQTFWYGGHCQSLVNPNVKVIPFFFKRYVRGIIRLIEWLSPRMLCKLFVRGNYDIEIAASDGGAAKVIAGSNNKKSKKVCWVHMDVVEQGSRLKEFSKKSTATKIYSKFDKIVCVSKKTEEQFNRKFGFENNTTTVHNPLPKQSIIDKSNEEIGVPLDDKTFNIVAVGRLSKEKGFERLIRVCERLRKETQIPVVLYIVGDGPMRTELEQMLQLREIDNVKLLGFQANPYPYIKRADLLVCASHNEAYPTVIGESFVLETPVLGTKCSGVCEWLEVDSSGYIVENNEEALYEGLKAVIQNEQIFEELKMKACVKAKSLEFEQALKLWEQEIL